MHKQANVRVIKAVLFISLVLPCVLPAQITFERTYGGADDDKGHSVQQTSDGGYIIAGFTYSFGAGWSDIYLIKIDARGDTLWTRTYGGMDNDLGYCIKQTSDSGYIIVGMTKSFDLHDENVYLIKTDANGDTLWTRTYSCRCLNYGYSVQQTSDQGYIIVGATTSCGIGTDYGDVYLIKTDTNGDTLWTRTYGSINNSESGRSVQQTSDHGYIIAGVTWLSAADHLDIYLVKTDVNGDILWTRKYGGKAHEAGYSVQQTSDGGYIIAGWTVSFGAGQEDVYLIRTDTNGDTLWTRTYGGADWDEGRSVQQTSDGGYIIAGFTYSFDAGWCDVYLIKTDADGDTLWTRTYGGTRFDMGRSVQQTSDGGYIIAGTTSSFGAGGTDVYLIKTDADGLVTGIEEECCNSAPSQFSLAQNFPNPFYSETQIKFALPKEANVSLEVYDVTGRTVKTLVNKKMGAGYHSVKWDAKNVSSGVYFYKIKADDYTETRKMIMVR